jgi:hypothetical protein
MGTRSTTNPDESPSELVDAVAAAMAQPRARQLNPAERARLQRAARDAALLYPDNPDLQQCAVDAAIDYLHHTADLDADGAEWHRIRLAEKRLAARVRQLAVMSVADKAVSERRAASVIFVDRMALRRWSGKAARARKTRSAQEGSR